MKLNPKIFFRAAELVDTYGFACSAIVAAVFKDQRLDYYESSLPYRRFFERVLEPNIGQSKCGAWYGPSFMMTQSELRRRGVTSDEVAACMEARKLGLILCGLLVQEGWE